MPLAEHDLVSLHISELGIVSIHVPLAEHDQLGVEVLLRQAVSIHVPLAEHDGLFAGRLERLVSFNSRAPRGARLVAVQGDTP